MPFIYQNIKRRGHCQPFAQMYSKKSYKMRVAGVIHLLSFLIKSPFTIKHLLHLTFSEFSTSSSWKSTQEILLRLPKSSFKNLLVNLCVLLGGVTGESGNFTEDQTCSGAICAKAFLFQMVNVILTSSGRKLSVIGIFEIQQGDRIVDQVLFNDNFEFWIMFTSVHVSVLFV